MNSGTMQQTYIFLLSAFGGVILGFIYDIFRVLRRILKWGKKITFILDIIFWVTAAGICFYFMEMTNDGQFRWFLCLGYITGFLLYYLIVGSKFLNGTYFLTLKTFGLIVFIVRILLMPFNFLLKILRLLFLPIGKILKKIDRRAKKNIRIRFNVLTRDIKKGFNIIKNKK